MLRGRVANGLASYIRPLRAAAGGWTAPGRYDLTRRAVMEVLAPNPLLARPRDWSHAPLLMRNQAAERTDPIRSGTQKAVVGAPGTARTCNPQIRSLKHPSKIADLR